MYLCVVPIFTFSNNFPILTSDSISIHVAEYECGAYEVVKKARILRSRENLFEISTSLA